MDPNFTAPRLNAAIASTVSPSSTAPLLGHITAAIFGLHFERIRYWSDILPVIAQPREPLIVRYDPRDISRLHVIGKDYHRITYANITRPPISLEEVRNAYRTLRAQGNKSTNEARIFEYRAQQRALVASASTATKAMRRKTERLRPTLSITSATSTIDYSQEGVPSAGETWTTSR
jgi:DNA-binding transcriptional MerR regulator